MKSTGWKLAWLCALTATAACGGDSSAGDNANDNNVNVNSNNNNSNVSGFCGDGVIDAGELCDASALGGEDCVSVGQGFVSGTLSCDGSCGFDTSGCVAPMCGDGVVDTAAGEECDDGSANSDTAPDACRTDCLEPWCGDGVIDPGQSEECDGLAMGGVDCGSLGYPGGTLTCALTCDFDQSGCLPVGTCTLNADCVTVGEYCEKVVGDCAGTGMCAARPGVCPGVWDPVCGCDAQTYGNACVAAEVAVNVDYTGQCVVGGCSTNTDCPASNEYCAKAVGDCNGTGQCTVMPGICPGVWDPMCGCDGTTYGNACEAAAAGVVVDYAGGC